MSVLSYCLRYLIQQPDFQINFSNHLDSINYKYFLRSDDPWICATCCSAIFQFASLKNNCFLSAIPRDRFNKSNEKHVETKDISLLLNPSPNLALFLTNLITPDVK